MGISKGFAVAHKELTEFLRRCPQVSRYDKPGEDPEAATIAHAFLDLKDAFRLFVDKQLPQLEAQMMAPDEAFELLQDIGENLRHIQYHIQDPQFYKYLGDSWPRDNSN